MQIMHFPEKILNISKISTPLLVCAWQEILNDISEFLQSDPQAMESYVGSVSKRLSMQ
jgi:hypothetical protein